MSQLLDEIIPSKFESRFELLDPLFARLTWADIKEQPNSYWVAAADPTHRMQVAHFLDKYRWTACYESSPNTD